MGWATIGLIISKKFIVENDCGLITGYIDGVTRTFINNFDDIVNTITPKDLMYIISQTKKGSPIEKICGDLFGIKWIPEQPLCDYFKIPEFQLDNGDINFEIIIPMETYLENPSQIPIISNGKIFPYDKTIRDIDYSKLTLDCLIPMLELHMDDYIIKLQYKI